MFSATFLSIGVAWELVKSTSGQLQIMLGSLLIAMAVAVGFVIWFVVRSKNSTTRTELPEKIDTW